jgi:sugar phosphate isomerase/epimerase
VFVAASAHSFADKPLAEVCKTIADLEFDKIELWLSDHPHAVRPSQIAADFDRACMSIRDLTRLTPVAIYLDTDADGPTFRSITRFAKALRIAQITVCASPLGTPFNTEIDRLKEMVSSGNSDGVRVSLKTQIGALTEDPDTAVELCQSVRGLGLTLDPSCYLVRGVRFEALERMSPHIYHVHLRDSSRQELQVPVGLGEIDYSRLVNMLKSAHYLRALTVDLLPDQGNKLDRPLEMRKLRLLLESLL